MTAFRDLAQAGPAPESTLKASAAAAQTPLDGPSLTAYLSRRYPDAPRSKADHYEWMVAVLSRCSLSTVEQLNQALVDVASRKVAAAMDHKLPAGQIRRLDDDLLVALGGRYAHASMHGSVNEASRLDLLQRRRERLVRSGFRFD